ncbi:hypothetical protein PENTCL1PPCAC_15837, partial [Pristionchus entomophagus]
GTNSVVITQPTMLTSKVVLVLLLIAFVSLSVVDAQWGRGYPYGGYGGYGGYGNRGYGGYDGYGGYGGWG